MDNQKPNMTRGQYRKEHKPFYKKAPFIIILVVILIAIIAGIIYWSVGNAHKNNADNDNDRVENVQSNKNQNSSKKNSKSADSKSVKKGDQPSKKDKKSDSKKQDKKSDKTFNNPGSYKNLDYKTDDFEFKMSNDVKLVKDSNGDPALLIKYTYTNKTNKAQIAQKVQTKNMVLKQGDKVLTPTGGDGDYSSQVSSTNMNEVKPNTSFDGALLVKVNDANSDVNMYFMNIKTNKFLDTMQPFKLS